MTEWRVPFTVPGEHPCYADHFPGHVIVPGAVLLEWIQQALQQRCPGSGIQRIVSFRFLHVVAPGDQLELCFRLAEDKSSVQIDCVRIDDSMNDNMNNSVRVSVAKGKWLLGVAA